jgi:hypothetical protein
MGLELLVCVTFALSAWVMGGWVSPLLEGGLLENTGE